ncbi:Arm DNA-binding domain-containing protein [Thalassorhabdomicrobium marinisediminis]|uniref:Arm DNA-binding domain-containing protein n=1 Tax=Thalassorhabdomicrobium marinisediminis TaxID=2170577 RepID=UPI001304DF62
MTDVKETGLLVRAFPSGRKTFAFRFRGLDGKIQSVVIGTYPDVKLAAARTSAAALPSVLDVQLVRKEQLCGWLLA